MKDTPPKTWVPKREITINQTLYAGGVEMLRRWTFKIWGGDGQDEEHDITASLSSIVRPLSDYEIENEGYTDTVLIKEVPEEVLEQLAETLGSDADYVVGKLKERKNGGDNDRGEP